MTTKTIDLPVNVGELRRSDYKEWLEYAYLKGKTDIGRWANYVLDGPDSDSGSGFLYEDFRLRVPQHFYEIWDALDSGKDTNVIIARGHAKTTATLIWILHALCYKKERRLLYIASAELGEVGIGKIRGELESNRALIELHGNLVPNNSDDVKDKRLKKWRGKELELLNGCWVKTLTRGAKVRGQRPNKIIFDDPQDYQDVESSRQVKKFNRWAMSSLYGTLPPSGSMCVLGTIIGKQCFVKWLRDEKDWHTIEYQACDRDFNNILWPEMWSKESLEDRLKQMGSAVFNQEYRNIPLDTDDAVIKEEWIKTWKVLPEKFDFKIMAVDPKSSLKQKGDDMGVCIIGCKLVEGDLWTWVLYSKGVKLSPLKQKAFWKELYKKYEPNVLVKEDNIEKTLTEEIMQEGEMTIVPVTASTDKYNRLLSVAPSVEFGLDYFRGENKDGMLIDQLTSFPNGDADDVMDAWVWAKIGAKAYKGKRIHQLRRA